MLKLLECQPRSVGNEKSLLLCLRPIKITLYIVVGIFAAVHSHTSPKACEHSTFRHARRDCTGDRSLLRTGALYGTPPFFLVLRTTHTYIPWLRKNVGGATTTVKPSFVFLPLELSSFKVYSELLPHWQDQGRWNTLFYMYDITAESLRFPSRKTEKKTPTFVAPKINKEGLPLGLSQKVPCIESTNTSGWAFYCYYHPNETKKTGASSSPVCSTSSRHTTCIYDVCLIKKSINTHDCCR